MRHEQIIREELSNNRHDPGFAKFIELKQGVRDLEAANLAIGNQLLALQAKRDSAHSAVIAKPTQQNFDALVEATSRYKAYADVYRDYGASAALIPTERTRSSEGHDALESALATSIGLIEKRIAAIEAAHQKLKTAPVDVPLDKASPADLRDQLTKQNAAIATWRDFEAVQGLKAEVSRLEEALADTQGFEEGHSVRDPWQKYSSLVRL